MKAINIALIIVAGIFMNTFSSCNPSCCVDFDSSSSFPAGTIYSHYNDSVYYSCGYTLFTDYFLMPPRTAYYGSSRIIPAQAGFGSGQVINTNNSTLKFTNVFTPVSVNISFDYQAKDTIQNLSVNGALYIGELNGAPATLGGATIAVTSNPVGSIPYNKKGSVTINGIVKEFNIGGREFYLDNICFQ